MPVRRFVDGAFPLRTPSQVVRDAQGYAEALKPHSVIVARDPSTVGFACQKAAIAGLMAQGVQAIDIGAATLGEMRHAQWTTGAGGAMHISRDRVMPLGALGTRLTRDETRKLLGALAREDYAMPFSGVTRPPLSMTGTSLPYISHVVDWSGAAFAPPSAPQIAVFARHEQLLSLAERVFRAAGLGVRAEWEEELMVLSPGELGIWLNEDGERCAFVDEVGALTEAERMLLISWVALERGEKELLLPRGATRAVLDLTDGYRATVTWTRSDVASWQKALRAASPDQFMLHFDGIASALAVLCQLKKHGLTLRGAVRMMPSIHRRSVTLPIDLREKGRLVRMLSESLPDADLTDGVLVERENGWAWISPSGDRRECVVMAESRDAEFARELCDFYSGEVGRVLRAAPTER